MRYFKIKISQAPDVTATIRISDFHLRIFKEILMVKTDREFGNSLKVWVKQELEAGSHPEITKSVLEHRLSSVLAGISSNYLRAFFAATEGDDITEIAGTELEFSTSGEDAQSEQGKVIQFSDSEE